MVKYQIFVSSTYEDLMPERDQVIKAILEMGHIPVGMEMFSAADEQQWEIIKKQIDQSDYYLVIIARRYGSMDGDVSYTEKEYDYALERKIPVLGFILSDGVAWPDKWIENNRDIQKRLDKFKAKVSGRMVSFWNNSDDLYGKCGIALMKAFAAQPREGWVRSSEANTGEMTVEITRLSSENGRLRMQVEAAAAAKIEAHEAKVNNIIDALRLNSRKIYVWRREAKNWGEPMKTNLLTVFEVVAQDMINEASNETLAASLGFHFAGNDTRQAPWPVPSNFLKGYISDLVSLDLVSTSTRRHTVSDIKAYWMLTEFGREVYGQIRKNELLKGLAEFHESPDDEKAET